MTTQENANSTDTEGQPLTTTTPMAVLTLKRTHHRKDGTFGVLDYEGEPFALTRERPWLNNQRGVSCIPVGEYPCARVTSPRFGPTFQVCDVPNRSEILFHKGNIEDDSHGCILVGEQFGGISGKVAVLASKAGFEEFLSRLDGRDGFKLVIVNC